MVLLLLLMGKDLDERNLYVVGCISFVFSVIYALSAKGSLVESMTFDYERKEIRVKHYCLPFRERETTIPFEGMHWKITQVIRSVDLLIIYPKEGRKIGITTSHLGWKWDSTYELRYALGRIVSKDFHLFDPYMTATW